MDGVQSRTAVRPRTRYDRRMALAPDGVAAEEVRLEKMLEALRAAERRRLVKQGMALWIRSERAYRETCTPPAPPRGKPN